MYEWTKSIPCRMSSKVNDTSRKKRVAKRSPPKNSGEATDGLKKEERRKSKPSVMSSSDFYMLCVYP